MQRERFAYLPLQAVVGADYVVMHMHSIIESKNPQYEYVSKVRGGRENFLRPDFQGRQLAISRNFRVPLSLSFRESPNDVRDFLTLASPKSVSLRATNDSSEQAPAESGGCIDRNRAALRELLKGRLGPTLLGELRQIYGDDGEAAVILSLLERSPETVGPIIIRRLEKRYVGLVSEKLGLTAKLAGRLEAQIIKKAADSRHQIHLRGGPISFRVEDTCLLTTFIDEVLSRTQPENSDRIRECGRDIVAEMRTIGEDVVTRTTSHVMATCIGASLLSLLQHPDIDRPDARPVNIVAVLIASDRQMDAASEVLGQLVSIAGLFYKALVDLSLENGQTTATLRLSKGCVELVDDDRAEPALVTHSTYGCDPVKM